MLARLLLLVLLSSFLAACASPGRAYAEKRPEMSPEHREILSTGHVPIGTAVAGLTRQEVRLAMGRDPSQFSKEDGLDAWIFAPDANGPPALGGENRDVRTRDSGGIGTFAGSAAAPGGAQEPTFQKSTAKITVYFRGDRAVRADSE